MGRANLSRCQKTLTFTWRKRQSTPSTLLVKQSLSYPYHCELQVQHTTQALLITFPLWNASDFTFCPVSPFSTSFLPGVPVAGRLCSLRHGRLPVHRVLLQCCWCTERGQYWSHLVCPDCSLLPVSFICKLPPMFTDDTDIVHCQCLAPTLS